MPTGPSIYLKTDKLSDEDRLLHTDFFLGLISSMRQEITIQKQIRNSMIILKFIFLKMALISITIDVSKMLNIKYAFTILSLTVIYLDLISCQKVEAIKRVGQYFRKKLEPVFESLREDGSAPDNNHGHSNKFDFYFWETYLEKDKSFYKKSMFGTIFICNIFLALFLLILSFVFELYPEICFETITLMGALGICFYLEVIYNLKGAGIIQ